MNACPKYKTTRDGYITGIDTDCRSEEGITVGLIDTIINCVRLLSTRDLSTPVIKEALLDLREDQDIANLFSCITKEDINDRYF